MIYKILFSCFVLFPGLLHAQDNASLEKLRSFIQNAAVFSYDYPQEKVFLHLDNSSYAIGDTLWFKAYVVTADSNRYTPLSKVLYVDLLTPAGNVIDTRKLKITGGQCHGEFPLNKLLMYSGYHEIRAYTRYMANFGDATAFSRVFPVFDAPETEGHYQSRRISGPKHPLPNLREKPGKYKKVNISFFPEGGNLVYGLTSRIALKVTDNEGNETEAQGYILNPEKDTVSRFITRHRGTGVFGLTPRMGNYTAEFVCKGKTYTAELPECQAAGYVLQTDNQPDTIGVYIRNTKVQPADVIALLVQCRGRIYNCTIIRMPESAEHFIKIPASELPTGVAQISLMNTWGQIVADRLIFVNHKDQLGIRQEYKIQRPPLPFEEIRTTFQINDRNGQPAQTTMSVAIRDAATDLPGNDGNNMLTELLLSSDLKGYIRQPSYYFEADDSTRRRDLDLLMMTQGWRRYDLQEMNGVKPFNPRHAPEQGIIIDGFISPVYSHQPLENVEISIILEKDSAGSFIGVCHTDSLGRFEVLQELEGDWKAVIQTRNNGKNKNYDIRLNRNFTPTPRSLSYAETHQEEKQAAGEQTDTVFFPEERQDSAYSALRSKQNDSLRNIFRNTHLLPTVTVQKRKKITETEENLKSAAIIYDAQQEMDEIIDRGEYISYKNISKFLSEINKKFIYWNNSQSISYKNKAVCFVFNDKLLESLEFQILEISDIHTIAISESQGMISKYIKTQPPEDFGCVVLLYGDWKPHKSKGIRITKIKGYSPVAEYYHANRQNVLPADTDYRRTLYWNPCLRTDSTGRAEISFYNNSSCNRFKVSAATIGKDGEIGILEN